MLHRLDPCPKIPCLPGKNVIHSAKVAWYARRGAEWGIAPSLRPIDMVAVRDRKRRMVDDDDAFYLQKYRHTGAELVMGRGRLVGPRTTRIGG